LSEPTADLVQEKLSEEAKHPRRKLCEVAQVKRIFKDDGHGVTDLSLKFFREVKGNIGTIIEAEASQEPLRTERDKDGYLTEYNLILADSEGNEIWLSGCNCGYGGTGPHGTFEILKEVGLLSQDCAFEDSSIPDLKHCAWGITKLEAETSTPKLKDFCEHCRPLMKQVLDEIQVRVADLKELTEPPQKPGTITIPLGEAPR